MTTSYLSSHRPTARYSWQIRLYCAYFKYDMENASAIPPSSIGLGVVAKLAGGKFGPGAGAFAGT